ncbi:uncharacterized protein LOC100680074 [Nasonia vitripennis]|uniref:Uncharacterized protein n=1 Tax=Nasonia vitripennis TaxID=7425 RepID=A0A7M7H606_NASVI|nr:uncharacterized protein LOC100680074 [Nasonia vitripennis]XP_008208676.1 uncharacterized protein LOC100680074 [Nasonia vitripennis]XP_008208677.1 uncharacterized protein LOC100680074 [Nasonia vitripennis]
MNRKWKEKKQKEPKNSPVLFEDEENGTSSSDEVKKSKLATPNSSQTKTYSGHSTPIQKKADTSEFPEIHYNESPIEPLTQHPPSEVGWDYQRPINKDEEEVNVPNPMEITKTPKRGVLLAKKRNSNSPLLYKPLKKKLIQEEQQESMAGFVKELKAMEMKAKEMKDKKGEKFETQPKTEDRPVESQLVVEMDTQPSDDSDIKLQISSPQQGEISMAAKNYDVLLDDSIEDIMIMCSQEVEAKEFGNQKNQPVTETKNQPNANVSKEKISVKPSPNSSLEKMFSNLAKENIQPLNNTDKFVSDTSSKSSSVSKVDSASLEIPDDSFDDFFGEIDDRDFSKNVNSDIQIGSSTNKLINKPSAKSVSTISSTVTSSKTATSQNNTLQSKPSIFVQTKNTALATYNCISDTQASSASVQTKVINTKANFGYLNKESYAVRNTNSSGFYSQMQTSLTTNNDARLFKSKSYSDSNFQQRNSVTNFVNNSTSNLGISADQYKGQSMTSIYQNSKSTHCTTGSAGESKSVRRIQSSSSLGNPNTYDNVSQRSSVNSSGRSQSTPAEIERKRQEAIMKREAKMKSKLNNPTLNRPPQSSIKR